MPEDNIAYSHMMGTLLGCALGDAIGLYTEFLPKATCAEYYGSNPVFTLQYPPPAGTTPLHDDYHRARFVRGSWTDDTDQAILILLSFLRNKAPSGEHQLDARDFAKRIRFWMDSGLRPLDRLPLGIGKTVGSVVTNKRFLDDPFATATNAWEKTDRFLAANGAVMRTGVIGALMWQDHDGVNGIERSMRASIEVARTTHADPRCLVSCAIVTGLVAAAVRQELKTPADLDCVVQQALAIVQSQEPNLSEPHLAELHTYLNAEHLASLELDDRKAIGYTYKCLGSGIWALRQFLRVDVQERWPIRFERIITELTMEGGDADTNCAVAGALIGAYIGIENLSALWTRNLTGRDWLMSKMDGAAFILGVQTGRPYDFETDEDSLIDGGKGEMSKETMEGRVMALQGDIAKRMQEFDKLKGKGKSGDSDGKCVIM